VGCALIALTALLATACGRDESSRHESGTSGQRGASQPDDATAAAARPRIVFLGDSLTAGLGVGADQAYPALVGRRLREAGLDFEVVNAGVSGDTSAGGLRRAEWSLQGDARVLVIAIGANDGLRGLPASELKRNLEAILDVAERRRVAVLLAGMEAPPNFGEAYTRDFRGVYADLATARRVRFLPFLLRGVAGDPALNQADGIHPNPEGHRVIADLVWRALQPLLPPPAS
jgi:acyl-CoA thioesterase-1